MDLKEIVLTQQYKELQNAKKGIFHLACWKKDTMVNDNLYTKITTQTIRFVCYGNMANVSNNYSNGNTNNRANNTIVLIKDKLTYNQKTNNFLVSFKTTQNSNHRAKVKYLCNGVEIDKETYESVVPPRKNSNQPLLTFTINFENLIFVK